MPDLLLELFSEEIPARMQEAALAYLQNKLQSAFGKPAKGFVTPRRLAVIINDLPAVEPDVTDELKGPKIGAPEAALQGFLKKNNLTQKDLTERDGVYFATVHQKGRSTAVALKTIIEHLLGNFPWPKSMRWGNNDITWVRPLHSILCIFDGKVISVEFGPVKAGNVTYGHRFLSPQAITIKNPADYEAALEKAHVIADREKRKAEILKQAEKVTSPQDLTIKKDGALLEEVVGLVEWPVVLMGKIDAAFHDLPIEVLISEMRTHQKYFALQTVGGGFVSHSFLFVANMVTQDKGKAIIAGNERVLRARLADGRFFWNQDRKKSLAEWADGLKNVTFHAKLGSVADKVERIKTLALALISNVDPGLRRDDVERAAILCKADLVTGMVGEFPELQGVMGWYYALAHERREVADAIRDHYKPQGPNDSVPTQPVSICIALADKLDTLVSMFAIGEKPTGSKDPFALRRAALGVIRIIRENKIRCNLVKIIPTHAEFVQQQLQIQKLPLALGISSAETIAIEVLGFLADRLIVQIKDEGIQHDVIKAVFTRGESDIVRLVVRAKELQKLLNSEDGTSLLSAYKRAINIVEAEEKRDKRSYTVEPNTGLLKLDEEKQLYKVLCNLLPAIDLAIQEESFTDLMEMAASMRKSIDAFFDKILVNDKAPEVRINRLCLLAQFRTALDKIANFALIEG